jgi:peptide/nickel transport system substrate-binding protein
MRGTRAVLIILSLVGLLSIQVLGQAAPRVVVAQGTEPATLDAILENARDGYNITLHIYDPLVMRNDKLELQPHLAESFRWINNTTLRFVLRKGIKFHNGEPLTSAAVKFTMDIVMDPKTPTNYLVADIKEVQVVDDYTIDFITRTPAPTAVGRLTSLGIVPPQYIQKNGRDVLARQPVGTGPYRLKEWIKDDHVTLTVNRFYWKGTPEIEQITFRAIPDGSARVAALRTGEVDIITNFPPDLVGVVGANAQVLAVPSIRSINILLDSETKELADKRVRQAINYTVDRVAIVKNVLLGFGVPNSTLIPPNHFGFDASLRPYPYDPAKAKQLLREAGFPNGFSVVFNSPRGRYLKDAEVSQAVVGYLQAVGIKADLRYHEWGNYLKLSREHKLGPMHLIGSGIPTMDAADPLINVKCGEWFSYYCNTTLDELYLKARATVDPKQRVEILKQAQRLVYEEAPILFMYTQKDIYGVSKRLDWKPRSDETLWLAGTTVR